MPNLSDFLIFLPLYINIITPMCWHVLYIFTINQPFFIIFLYLPVIFDLFILKSEHTAKHTADAELFNAMQRQFISLYVTVKVQFYLGLFSAIALLHILRLIKTDLRLQNRVFLQAKRTLVLSVLSLTDQFNPNPNILLYFLLFIIFYPFIDCK